MGSRWVKRHDEGDGQAREMRGRQGGWARAGTWTVRVREWWVGRVEVGEWCGDVEVTGRDEGR